MQIIELFFTLKVYVLELERLIQQDWTSWTCARDLTIKWVPGDCAVGFRLMGKLNM